MALIRTLQTEMWTWQREQFGDTVIEQATLGMVEEMGEVAKIVLKSGQQHRGANLDMLKAELGDVFIYMAHVASLAGISLEEAIVQKWDKVQRRVREEDNETRKVENAD